jgi:Cyclic nucleotide-binding domain/Major Facilitator Superfamily
MELLRTTLGNRDLTRIEAAFAVAALGNWAFSILLAIYAYRQGGTGAVAVALVVRMLPSGLAAPYTAMLVDRHSRRAVLVWASVARAVSLAGAAGAAAAGTPLGVVLAFAAAFTIANTAHRPAQAALMPQLARTPAELAAANVCWTAIDYAGFLLGSVLAGMLAGLIELDIAFAVSAATFALTTLVVGGLPADRRPPPLDEEARGLAELAEGLRTVREHAEIRLLVGLLTVDSLIQGIFDVLVVIAAIELLGLGESGAGWLNAAWGVGGVLGGVAALALLGRGRLASGLTVGMAVAGLGLVAVGIWPETAAAVPLLVLAGVGFALVQTALDTLTQRLVADEVLGRVFGVEETIEVVALAVGSIVAAALVELLGVDGAIIAAGAVLPLAAALTARRVASSEAGAQVSERTFGLVRSLPLFTPLPIAVQENIALRLTERGYGPGERIVKQGEVGDSFFVIADGEVQVQVDGATRRVQHAGDFFGEIALLRDVPRTASVSAVGPVTVLVIDREEFLVGVGGHPRSAHAAERVVAERLDADLIRPA